MRAQRGTVRSAGKATAMALAVPAGTLTARTMATAAMRIKGGWLAHKNSTSYIVHVVRCRRAHIRTYIVVSTVHCRVLLVMY
eukprot:scaffold34347_cov118-Isochrysis_galbana.AAC.7